MSKVANVPQVMQMEALECGAACLDMILAYYGKWVPLERVRADCGVSRDGSKATSILKAARSYGLSAKGMAYSTEALRTKATFPCIVFWNFNHFVVLKGFRGKYAYLNDPARGQIRLTIDEFDQSFTGVTLIFERTDSFEEGGSKPDMVRYALRRLDGLGPAITFVMLAAALSSLVTLITMTLSKVFMDQILIADNTAWLMPLLAILLALAIISGTASILNAIRLMRIQGKIAVVSSTRFMWHLLHLPVGFYAQRTVGDLQMRQSTNETIAYILVSQLAPVLINVAMLVLNLVIMIDYSVVLTIVGLLTVVINAFAARYISKKRVNITRAQTIDMGKLYATTVGGIQMIETIKATGAENGYFNRWAGYQANVNEAAARTTRLNVFLGSIPQLLTSLVDIVVLVLGVALIVRGDFTPGMLLAFTGFFTLFMTPVNQLINLSQTVQEMQTHMERIEDVMRYEPDVPEELAGAIDASGLDSEKLRGQVDMEGVTFGYSPIEAPLIEDFDLHLEPGQWVALVGDSGSGKSTVGKLVSGLYEPWSGAIKFDGTPLKDVPRPVLRGSLAVVDQDIVTFDGTISDNVKLWDSSIEDYEVILACRDANIHDVIVDREDGYSSRVMPGGRNFSGGQLQRLEIARVLAQDPSIIILDEATSALDAQTEAEVIRRIRDRDITCIVVAHRLSTIRDCDEIIVLENGKVVERGTHSDLLAQGGAYAELVGSD